MTFSPTSGMECSKSPLHRKDLLWKAVPVFFISERFPGCRSGFQYLDGGMQRIPLFTTRLMDSFLQDRIHPL